MSLSSRMQGNLFGRSQHLKVLWGQEISKLRNPVIRNVCYSLPRIVSLQNIGQMRACLSACPYKNLLAYGKLACQF